MSPAVLLRLIVCRLIIIIIVVDNIIVISKVYKELFGSAPCSRPVIVNKSIVQQSRIKSLHHNGNPLKYFY